MTLNNSNRELKSFAKIEIDILIAKKVARENYPVNSYLVWLSHELQMGETSTGEMKCKTWQISWR